MEDDFLAELAKITGNKSLAGTAPKNPFEEPARKLGVDPVDLATIVSFETGGTFDPHKVGGAGNRYKGSIQFGEPEQRLYYKPNQTLDEQLNDGVVRFFQDSFKKAGKDTKGATLEDLYTTVIAGNPGANRNTRDAFGTSARSGVERMVREHRPKVLQKFFGGAEREAEASAPSFLSELQGITKGLEQQPQQQEPDFLGELKQITGDALPDLPAEQADVNAVLNKTAGVGRTDFIEPAVVPEVPEGVQPAYNLKPDQFRLIDSAQMGARGQVPVGYVPPPPQTRQVVTRQAQTQQPDQPLKLTDGTVLTPDANKENLTADERRYKDKDGQPFIADLKTKQVRREQLITPPTRAAEASYENKFGYLGANPLTKVYKQKPSVEQVVQDGLVSTYGANFPAAARAFKEITGGKELWEQKASREEIQSAIDNAYDEKTKRVNIQFENRENVHDFVEAFEKGGIEGLKAKIAEQQGQIAKPPPTPEEAQAALADDQIAKDLAEEKRVRNTPSSFGDAATIAWNAVTNPLGAVSDAYSTVSDYRNDKLFEPPSEEEIRARKEFLKGTHIDADTREQAESDAEWLNRNAGNALNFVTPALSPFLSDETKNDIAASTVGGYAKSVGGVYRTLAGIARPFSGSTYQLLSRVAEKNEALGEKTGTGGTVSQIFKIGGATPTDLAQLYLATRIPGLPGTIIGFSLHSAVQSAGRGESRSQITKEAVKGGALGGVFGVAPYLGKFAESVAANKLVNLADVFPTTTKVLTGVAREGTTLATIGGGTYTIERIAGTPAEEALKSSVVNSLFHIVNAVGSKAFNRTYRGTDRDGNQVYATVTPEGKVKELKGEVTDPDVIDLHFNKTTGRYEPSFAESVRTPRERETRIVEQDQPSRGLALPGEVAKPSFEVRRESVIKDAGYSDSEIASMTSAEKQEIFEAKQNEAKTEVSPQPAPIQAENVLPAAQAKADVSLEQSQAPAQVKNENLLEQETPTPEKVDKQFGKYQKLEDVPQSELIKSEQNQLSARTNLGRELTPLEKADLLPYLLNKEEFYALYPTELERVKAENSNRYGYYRGELERIHTNEQYGEKIKAEKEAIKGLGVKSVTPQARLDSSMLTQKEYLEKMQVKRGAAKDLAVSDHYLAVEKALQEGKTVPPEVLADYPDLVQKYQAQATDTAPNLAKPDADMSASKIKSGVAPESKFVQVTPENVQEGRQNLVNTVKEGVQEDAPQVETPYGTIYGQVGDTFDLGGDEITVPEKGLLISEANLNEGVPKYQGRGKELYTEALKKYGTLYSSYPISDDALNVHNSLERRGLVEKTVLDDIGLFKLTATPKFYESIKDKPQGEIAPETVKEPVAKILEQPINESKARKVHTASYKTQIEPKVLDASDLITSSEKGYPQELQPRDIKRIDSRAKIESIAGNLDADKLGDESFAGDGRPIVVPVEVDGQTKYAVVAGNHRTEGIKQAYETGKAGSYAEFVRGKESTDAQRPVYVGVMNPKGIDLPKFAKEANTAQQRQMSPAEQAKADADLLDSDTLSKFVPAEDGSIHGAANRDFVTKFFKLIGDERASGLRTAEGKLSTAGETAIRNAIFAKAYGESEAGLNAIQRMAESTDNNVKNISNALLQKAGKFAELKQAVKDGTRFQGLDITNDLSVAMEKYSHLRDEGTSVEEYLQQQNLFGDDLTPFQKRVLQVFDAHKKSAKSINGILDNYVTIANEAGNPNQTNLFGESKSIDAASFFKSAVEEYEKGRTSQQQTSLFDADQGREDRPENRSQGQAPLEESTPQAEQPKSRDQQLGEVGSYGQTSHFLRKSGFANHPDVVRAITGSEPVETSDYKVKQDEANTVLDTIAKDLGVPRSSHISPKDWSNWLDLNADRLPLEAIKQVEDALSHQEDFNKKVTDFTSDKRLSGIIDGADLSKNFSQLPLKTRKEILNVGRNYGISDPEIRKAYDKTVLEFAQEKLAGRGIDQTRTETEVSSEGAENAGERASRQEVDKPLYSVPKRESDSIETVRDAQGNLLAPNGEKSNLPEHLWKTVRTPAFLNYFGDWINDPQNASKVVDENGEPLVTYSGHGNFELYGDKYVPKKTTAGAFYATESYEIASNYSTGKFGNMEGYEDGSQYAFKQKNGKYGKKLWQIEFTPEQQKIADDYIKDLGYDVVEYWKENRAYDADARRALARGGLRDAQSVFKFLENMGENIWYADHQDNRPYFEKQQKSAFEEILDKAGIEWQSHERSQPGVFQLFLNIRNPIDSESGFPEDLLKALEKKAGRVRDKFSGQHTHWTTDYPMRDWVDSIKEGNEYWSTQIPAKALSIIKEFGYDGVKELGLKGETNRTKRQVNWLAFEPTQIKNIFNRGTFSTENDNMLFSKPSFESPKEESLYTDLDAKAQQFAKLKDVDEIAAFKKSLLKEAEVKRIGNQIFLNPAGMELLRQAHGIAFSRALYQMAWHGSPHRFTKFDISKIGTGEGAQVYGHGLYFTDKESIADHYRRALSDNELLLGGKEIGRYTGEGSSTIFNGLLNGDSKERILEKLNEHLDKVTALGMGFDLNVRAPQIKEAIKNFEEDRYSLKNTGTKYKVDLKPEQDEYLLWDKPLSEQSEKVKKALENASMSNASRAAFQKNPTGDDIYDMFSHLPGYRDQKAASDYLKSLGIRGIKFLDGSSRSKGEGSFNYVIFDDADVSIEEILYSAQKQGIFYGAYQNASHTQDVINALKFGVLGGQMDAPTRIRAKRFIKSVEDAVDARYGDMRVIAANKDNPLGLKSARQEEGKHQTNSRTKARKAFTAKVALVPSVRRSIRNLGEPYEHLGITDKLDEVFAKSLTDDAENLLNISEKDVDDNLDALYNALEENDIDLEHYAQEVTAGGGKRSEQFAERIRNQSGKYLGETQPAGTGKSDFTTEGTPQIRQRGNVARATDIKSQPVNLGSGLLERTRSGEELAQYVKPENTSLELAPQKSINSIKDAQTINKREWWHVPPLDPEAYGKRGKFYSSSFEEAEFYGIKGSVAPETVNIQNPLVGDEKHIETVLLGKPQDLSQDVDIETRFDLDAKLAQAAVEKGYDAIALLTPKGFEAYQKSGRLPKSIELNTFENLKPPVKTSKLNTEVIKGDSVTELSELVKQGEKFNSVILDPAYFSKALVGGNRGVKDWQFITPEDFGKVMNSVANLVATDDTHVYLMLSGARTAQADMQKYLDAATGAGFQIVQKGAYRKTFKDGSPVTNVRGAVSEPETLYLLTKSGKARKGEAEIKMEFSAVRPNTGTAYQTQKSNFFINNLIRQSTLAGEKILDPFAGSGVSGVEAIKEGRGVTLIEKSADAITNYIEPNLQRAESQGTLFNRAAIKGLSVRDEILYSRPQTQTEGVVKKSFKGLVDIANAPKSLKSSLDISASLRQGAILSLSEPRLAKRAFIKQLQSLSKPRYDRFVRDLNLHPAIEAAEDAGLYLSNLESTHGVNDREEAFISRLLGEEDLFKNKALEKGRRVVSWHVRASERAYTTYLDSIRIEAFQKLGREILEYNKRKGLENDPEQIKALAKFINYATGRGDLGVLNEAAPALNTVFFSPRYWASRIQLLNPAFYAKLPPGTRKIALRKMLMFAGATTLIMALLKLAGGEIEDDPEQGDFMKVRFGAFAYDFGAGFLQNARYLLQMGLAAKGRLYDGKAPAFGKSEINLSQKLLRSKLSPTAGSIVNLYSGKNFIGEKATLADEGKNLIAPMIADEIPKAIEADKGLGLIKLAPSVLGVGVSIYEKKGTRPVRPVRPDRPERPER